METRKERSKRLASDDTQRHYRAVGVSRRSHEDDVRRDPKDIAVAGRPVLREAGVLVPSPIPAGVFRPEWTDRRMGGLSDCSRGHEGALPRSTETG